MAKLDRFLVSIEWELKFPDAKVVILPKEVSGHNHVRISFGNKPSFKENVFRFEKWWLELDEFPEIVKRTWEAECPHSDPMEVWQYKVRLLMRKIKGWNRNREAKLKKNKDALIVEIDVLDKLAEQQVLTSNKLEKGKMMSLQLEQTWRIEELKAQQRSRDRDIKEGDRNTTYFFAKAN
jgi:hypothetical protein